MKKALLIIILIITAFLNFQKIVLAASSQTWSKEGIQAVINETVSSSTIQGAIQEEKDKFNQELNQRLNLQQTNFIEIIGLFSAVLALIIINISIVKSANSFLTAISLIIGLTCSMVIFANLIHWFFSESNNTKGLLPLFIGIGVLLLLFITGLTKKDIGKN